MTPSVSVKGNKLMIAGWSKLNKKTVKKKVVVRSYFEKKMQKSQNTGDDDGRRDILMSSCKSLMITQMTR